MVQARQTRTSHLSWMGFFPALRWGLLLFSGFLGSCGLPGLEDAQVTLAPMGNFLKPGGKARLTSGPQHNGANSFSSALKLADRETDPAVTLFLGDGFSGFDLGYEQIKRQNSRGFLENDFGHLRRGEATESDLEYYGYRLAYVGRFYGYDFPSGIPLGSEYELQPKVNLGVGLGLHKVRWDLSVFDLDRGIGEDFKSQGTVPFLAFRAQMDLDTLKLRLDQSFSAGDWGDVTGPYWDTLFTIRWEAAPSVDILAGFRHFEISTEGHTGGNRYEMDADLTGYVVGLYLLF